MLPEDLMLLFLDDETGRVLMGTAAIHTALAGAVLVELVNSGRVAFEADGVKLAVVDPAPLQSRFLWKSLIRLNKPMHPKHALERLRPQVRENVMTQLVRRRVMTVENTRMFGIFPTKRYVIQDPQVITDLRDSMCKAALGRRAPDEHIRTLMALLYAVDAVRNVFEGDSDSGEIYSRAADVAAGDWAAEAVAQAMGTVPRLTSWAIVAAEMKAALFGGSS